MIPAAFDYQRAESADEAISLLAQHGDEAKLLAGGHSLLPLMKLRLASPSVLIDVGRLTDLSYVRDGGDHVAFDGDERVRIGCQRDNGIVIEIAGHRTHLAIRVRNIKQLPWAKRLFDRRYYQTRAVPGPG